MCLISRLSGLLCLLLTYSVSAQVINPEFERYSKTDGLSQNHTFCITQDKTGFIWFGTDEGLNRFDGHDFKVFKNKEGDSNSIIDNSIQALLVDSDSNIWIGTNNGICRYHPATEKITRFPVDYTDITKLSGLQVSQIKQAADGSIWISYIGDGINIIYPNKKEVFHYTVNRFDEFKIRNDLVSAIQFMPDGRTLIGTLDGIDVLDKDGKVLQSAKANKIYPWIEGIEKSITTFLVSSDKRTLWIATEMKGFYQIDLSSNNVIEYNKANGKLNFNYTTSLFEDSQGNIWLGSEELYLFEKSSQRLRTFSTLRINGDKSLQNSVQTIFEDRDKNIWLGTFSAGVLKFSPHNRQVVHHSINVENEKVAKSLGLDFSQDTQVLSFQQADKKNLWVGTDGKGLLLFDVDSDKFIMPEANSQFSSKVIKTIHKSKSGELWLGTWDGGLMKFDPRTNAVEIFHPDKKNFESIHVWDIEEDSLGNLWIATLRDGLCYFSPVTKQYKYYKNDPENLTSLVNNDIMALLLDSKKILWVASSNGLSVLFPGNTKFRNIMPDTTEFALSHSVLNCIIEDKNGKVWIGTNGGGITVFDKALNVVRTIKEKHGLPSNNISSLEADTHGNIWASTFKGVVKLSADNISILQIPQAGYLQEKQFSVNSHFKSTNGKLLFGSTNGFDIFHPDSLKFNPIHEQVVFTSLKIFNNEISNINSYEGRDILTKSIAYSDEVNLSYKDYSFTLTFAPITYNWQKGLHYQYMLENLDEDWQQTTSDRRFLHYSNLTPGTYILKVKASFDGKTWPEKATMLRINISPPWWGTWAFRLFAVLSTIMVLVALYKVRVDWLERQQKKLAHLVEVRTSELQRSNEELKEKNVKIEAQKEEIHALVNELSAQKHDIEQKNEELQTQHDILSSKSIALEEAQKKLQEVNKNLEQLIERRTSKLNTAVRELETFLYRASHDLRGPISSMLGLIRVAELENGKSDKLYIDFLRKTTLRLERTLAKLVQKHTIQKSKLQKEEVNKEILLDLLNEISIDIPQFRINTFEVSIQDDVSFETDKPMLAILVSNLLENAFFFSQGAKNKTVRLEVQQVENKVTISVTDYGLGIQRDLKDKIFTMFFRGSELSTGNGLGLYLVQNALVRINGAISLETEERKYTRFVVKLESL